MRTRVLRATARYFIGLLVLRAKRYRLRRGCFKMTMDAPYRPAFTVSELDRDRADFCRVTFHGRLRDGLVWSWTFR
jgi:hypothetical protein